PGGKPVTAFWRSDHAGLFSELTLPERRARARPILPPVSGQPTAQRSPIEDRLRRSLEDESGVGKPLSRRARQTRRTVEAYLRAGGIPRYMERLRDIDAELALHAYRLQRVYRALQAAC